MESTDPANDERPEDSPTAWFVVLEQALHCGDVERAAQAQRELERLGVLVRFRGRGRRRPVRSDR